nr:uncharacterized protein LOC129266789 [Lytechinus pictus]
MMGVNREQVAFLMGTSLFTPASKNLTMDAYSNLYEAEKDRPSSSAASRDPATSYQDVFQTHAAPRMYGTQIFKPRYGGEEEEAAQDEAASTESREECESYLMVDENSDFPEPIFPKGEHGYSLGKRGRFAAVQTLGGGVFVSVREYFYRSNTDGILQWYPTKKGIHLRVEEWRDLVHNISDIDARVRDAEAKTRKKFRKLEDRFVKKKTTVLYPPSDRPVKKIKPTPVHTQ